MLDGGWGSVPSWAERRGPVAISDGHHAYLSVVASARPAAVHGASDAVATGRFADCRAPRPAPGTLRAWGHPRPWGNGGRLPGLRGRAQPLRRCQGAAARL